MLTVAPVFDPPALTGMEVSPLTYTEGNEDNTVFVTATASVVAGDCRMTSVSLVVTGGFVPTDTALLEYVASEPVVVYDAPALAGPFQSGNTTVGALTLCTLALAAWGLMWLVVCVMVCVCGGGGERAWAEAG